MIVQKLNHFWTDTPEVTISDGWLWSNYGCPSKYSSLLCGDFNILMANKITTALTPIHYTHTHTYQISSSLGCKSHWVALLPPICHFFTIRFQWFDVVFRTFLSPPELITQTKESVHIHCLLPLCACLPYMSVGASQVTQRNGFSASWQETAPRPETPGLRGQSDTWLWASQRTPNVTLSLCLCGTALDLSLSFSLPLSLFSISND